MKLMHMTVATTASPGKVIHHQLPWIITSWALARVEPQESLGGLRPKPRKLTKASNTTLLPTKPKDATNPSERMRQAIDSPKGRQLYSQRFGTVEPVFANIRHNKRLTRFNHRGRAKVNTQWNLYCMVHNIEKLAKTRMGQHRVQ